jgi:hypothetical protein
MPTVQSAPNFGFTFVTVKKKKHIKAEDPIFRDGTVFPFTFCFKLFLQFFSDENTKLIRDLQFQILCLHLAYDQVTTVNVVS